MEDDYITLQNNFRNIDLNPEGRAAFKNLAPPSNKIIAHPFCDNKTYTYGARIVKMTFFFNSSIVLRIDTSKIT